ncbi:hypothetical protein AHiyo1_50140 [Arthrobacter sp. Hiyo1]|uniref:SLOG family protein n=1 Tax=Arthrobacter sp. Hiyo1 TaxID=1588020 RepID=UPI0006A36DF4|nr:SLOG family protein [Arthrobacter sp. Hiyo1]GAP61323.1 hypothetical protein AHiyo1_50140 [Arthrobacter sp. Hiyo1]
MSIKLANGHQTIKYSHVLLITGARSWDDEPAMRAAFRDTWTAWGSANVTSPLLISGQCPDGADAMAESLWRAEGFAVVTIPADWERHGRKKAGLIRNQQMVDLAVTMRMQGSTVRTAAFLDLCRKAGCTQRHGEQLMPHTPGHFSHGTMHCRTQAIRAGLETVDVIHSSLPPF